MGYGAFATSFEQSYYDDFEGARAFFKANRPELADKLEKAQLQTLRLDNAARCNLPPMKWVEPR